MHLGTKQYIYCIHYNTYQSLQAITNSCTWFSMRNSPLFAAASLGCLIIAAYGMASPQAVAVSSWPPFKKAMCASLVENYHDSGTRPPYGTPEYKRYAECYLIVCGTQLGW